MQALLGAWRERHWPVVHIQHLSQTLGSPLAPGQPGCQWKPGFAPVPGEQLIHKRVNSAFIGTGLESWLRQQGISEVVLAGLTTDHCVSTTARMAANFGFVVRVVSDATATFSRTGPNGERYTASAMHEYALASLHGEFATVVDSTSLLYAAGIRQQEREWRAS